MENKFKNGTNSAAATRHDGKTSKLAINNLWVNDVDKKYLRRFTNRKTNAEFYAMKIPFGEGQYLSPTFSANEIYDVIPGVMNVCLGCSEQVKSLSVFDSNGDKYKTRMTAEQLYDVITDFLHNENVDASPPQTPEDVKQEAEKQSSSEMPLVDGKPDVWMILSDMIRNETQEEKEQCVNDLVARFEREAQSDDFCGIINRKGVKA